MFHHVIVPVGAGCAASLPRHEDTQTGRPALGAAGAA